MRMRPGSLRQPWRTQRLPHPKWLVVLMLALLP
jgi:hypothetical protein